MQVHRAIWLMTIIVTKIDLPLVLKLKQLTERKFTLTDETEDEIIVVMNHSSYRSAKMSIC